MGSRSDHQSMVADQKPGSRSGSEPKEERRDGAKSFVPWAYPTAMLIRFGLFLRLFARRYFDRVRVEPGDLQRLQELYREGAVAHVLPSISVLDTLVLNRIFKKEGLPLARFLGGVRLILFWPFWRRTTYRLRRLFGKRAAEEPQKRFAQVLSEGGTSLLYVKRPKQFLLGGKSLLPPYVETLVDLQKTMEKPIYVVPEFVVWKQSVPRPKQSIWDMFFGDPDAPGALRKLFSFLRHSRRAFYSVGEPINVQELLNADQEGHAAEVLRTEILRRFNIERRAVAGPALKRASQIRDEILRNEDFDAELMNLAAEQNRSISVVKKEARGYLKEMTADFSLRMVDFLCLVLTFAFKRMYGQITVDPEGITRVREAGRNGPVIYIPCHRSHVDYLVLSYVLHLHGIVPPHIAAGSNLKFFPVGSLFRRGGAFFIRRSFRDNKVYAASFRAYLRKLVKEGVPVEFFIEGGRSRTGKTLPPRYGILKELVLTESKGIAQNIQVIPVGLSYERVVEDEAYRKELTGQKKTKESVLGVFKAFGVLFRKYGSLKVTFGEPLSIAEELNQSFPAPESSASESVHSELGTDTESSSTNYTHYSELPESDLHLNLFVKRLAYSVLRGINDCTMMTSTSLVAWGLLSHPRRGVRQEDLLTRIGLLITELGKNQVRMAPALESLMAARRATLDKLRQEADEALGRSSVIQMGRSDSEYGPHKQYYEAIGEAVKPLILETLQSFNDARYLHVEVFDDTTVYLVRAEQRIVVERYKNSVIHGLVRECLLAMAVCRALETRDTVRQSTVETDCATVSRLLKYEFVYDPGETFSESFAKTWEHFLKMGWLESDGNVARMPKHRAPVLQFFRRGLIKFVESYHLICVRAARLDRPTEESEFILQAIREGEKRYSAGELYAREACSTVTMKNALLIFEEMGAIRRWKEGRKSLVQLNGEEGLEILNNFNSHMASWTLWR